MAATTLTLPRTTLTMDEGRVVAWLKSPGDPVLEGEAVAEIETDKTTVQVVSTAGGFFRHILVAEGEVAPVGAPIAVITDRADEALPGDGPSAPPVAAPIRPAPKAEAPPVAAPIPPAPKAEAPPVVAPIPPAPKAEAPPVVAPIPPAPKAEAPRVAASLPVPEPRLEAPAPVPAAEAPSAGQVLRASPAVRLRARQEGIDLSGVSGTGPSERIIMRDLDRHLVAGRPPVDRPLPPAPALAPIAGEAQTMSTMRAAIAKAMTRSWQTQPQFSVTRRVDMKEILLFREVVGPSFEASGNVKLSVTDFLVQAFAKTLVDHPEMNSAADDQGRIITRDRVDLGLATALEGGLVVPAIRGAENLTLFEIARARGDLVERAKAGRLRSQDLGGTTFTLSNLGPFGVDQFQAIVSPGEAAIVAVGRIQETPVVKDGQIQVRPLMALTVSVDHRVTDGAEAGRFLQDVARRLESREGWILF